MNLKKFVIVSLAVAAASGVVPARRSGDFNNLLTERIAMAAPLQITQEERKAAEADSRNCATQLKRFAETADAAAYNKFRETFSKYLGYAKSSDPKEKLLSGIFRDSFFGASGDYSQHVKSGKSGTLEEAFRKGHPSGYMPNQFADALNEIYSRSAKGAAVPPELEKSHGADFVRLSREAYFAAHPEKKPVAPPSELVPVRVPIPQYVSDSTLNTFLGVFGISEALASSSRDEKMRGLVATMVGQYGAKTFKEAGDVATALMHAYSSLSDSEKKRFVEWLGAMEQPAKNSLGASIISISAARGVTLPRSAVAKAFEAWKSTKVTDEERIYSLKTELKRFDKDIRESNLWEMQKVFTRTTKDFMLEQMESRLLYLRKKEQLHKLEGAEGRGELAKVQKELSDMQAWLKRLGITDKTPELGLSTLRGGLQAIEIAYFTISKDNLKLAEYVEKVHAANRELYNIVTRHISEMDRLSAGMFSKVKPGDPAFATKIRLAVGSFPAQEKIDKGRQAWQQEYYPLVVPSAAAMPSPAEMRMFVLASTLHPAGATAFVDYMETVRRQGLEGGLRRVQRQVVDKNPITGIPNRDDSGKVLTKTVWVTEDATGTRKLAVQAVMRLYSLHPALVPKYFNAIRHVASLCEDNAAAFTKAMLAITAHIDAETDLLLRRSSPAAMMPSNIRKTTERLDRAFSELQQISKGTIAQFDRFNLLDDRILIHAEAPNYTEQRPLGYAPRLLSDETQPGGHFTPYPFPHYILTPTPSGMFTAGSVFTAQPTYGGGITLPSFRLMDVYTSAGAVKQSLRAYLYPQHPVLSLSRTLPGTIIPSMSPTKLLGEIERAFIQVERPKYSAIPIGGGLAGGVFGTKSGDKWDIGGGGLGTLLTPTGGWAIGGTADPYGTYGGASALAVPIGRIRGTEISLDTGLTGAEKFSDESWKILQRAITSNWHPSNPSQTLIVLNSDGAVTDRKPKADGSGYDVTRKWFTTARALLVEKDGTIYDLKGGQDELVPMLNFFAGYVNKAFNEPATYTWNYEPTVKKGGGALVFDVGKTPLLFHGQAIPFLTTTPAEGETATPQPLLVQWTLAGATTKEKPGKTTIYELAFPGQMLQLKSGTDGSKREDYYVQDMEFMMRRVKKEGEKTASAWELRMGGGAAFTPIGTQGRGGFFLRTQNPNYRLGGGSYYETGAANLKALALLQGAQDASDYVRSIHRIAHTVYGEKKVSATATMGALLHVVNQLQQAGGKTSYDDTFFRAVGVIAGMKSAVRLEVGRKTMFDEMLAEYDRISTQVANDPSQASSLISNFKDQYSARLRQVIDNYYLGIQLRKDFSLEASMVAPEDENKWTKQVPDTVYARTLYTWKTGFWRAFVAMPVLAVGGVNETSATATLGLAGTGFGTDLFDSVWFQRFAMDAGAVVARMETGSVSSTQLNRWTREGFFVQGALSVYSKVAEDSKAYRRLLRNHEEYRQHIRDGKFSLIPKAVREKMCSELSEKIFSPVAREDILKGKDFKPTAGQVNDLEEGLWRNWFFDQKFDIEERFNGKMRVLMAGSAYHFLGTGTDKGSATHWDIGAFVEYVDTFKAYAIFAKRDEPGLYLGAELTKARIRAALAGGFTPSSIGGAASIGYRFQRAGMPMELGLSAAATSSRIPEYAAPFYRYTPREATPEFSIMFYYTIGGRGAPFMQTSEGSLSPRGALPSGFAP